MNLGQIVGEICKRVFPISEEKFFGKGSEIAICTLSSIDLLKEIVDSDIMKKVVIVGRLFSENKGIDELVSYISRNPEIHTIVVCGKEVTGHKTGHALFCLHKFGVDDSNRIVNSTSPDPVLGVSEQAINDFRRIKLIDMIGQTELEKIISII